LGLRHQHGDGRARRSGQIFLSHQARQNVAISPARLLINHPLAGPTLRYGLVGATVAAVYLAIPFALNGVLGAPIQVAIPVAYVAAVTLHFNLQRHFVFRHVLAFALSRREQIARYVAVGAVQYPVTALSTAFVPGLLGISERAAFVATTLLISVTFFLVLRGHVFHPSEEPAPTSPAPRV
jgi:putative flippase GtrA